MSLRGVTKDWTPEQSNESTVYLGNERGTWPVHLFTNEAHAVHWAGENEKRRVWVADVKVLYEMEYVPPGQAQLRPKGGQS